MSVSVAAVAVRLVTGLVAMSLFNRSLALPALIDWGGETGDSSRLISMNFARVLTVLFLAGAGMALSGSAVAGGFDRAIEAASPRVVKLYGLGAGVQEGYGSGVMVREDGLVLTVLSLLLDANVIRVVTYDGTRYEAKVLHRDKVRQLALLKLIPPTDMASAREWAAKAEARRSRKSEVAESGAVDANDVGRFDFFDVCAETELSPGDWVLAAGNPFKVADGAEPVSVAHGVFSVRTQLDAQRRVKEFPYRGDVLVIDAVTSNPGAPGSALVNLDGKFVGLVGRVVTSNLTNTNFNYAIPRDVVCAFLCESLAGKDAGANSLSNSADASQNADSAATSQAVDLGIRIAKTGYQTVLPFVERVRPESPAAQAGVRKDDLILSVNGKKVGDIREYEARVGEIRSGASVVLVVRRGRSIVDLTLETKAE